MLNAVSSTAQQGQVRLQGAEDAVRRGRAEQDLLDDGLQAAQSTSIITIVTIIIIVHFNLSSSSDHLLTVFSSAPSQYGIVLYQSYNVPQQRKSSLSPFSAPVVSEDLLSLTSRSNAHTTTTTTPPPPTPTLGQKH